MDRGNGQNPDARTARVPAAGGLRPGKSEFKPLRDRQKHPSAGGETEKNNFPVRI
jgi:hypothetical protein